MGPRSHEGDNKQTKKIILLLKFACNTVKTDLRLKKILALSTKDNFELQNQTKVQIMLAVLFFQKIDENCALNDELCQKLWSTLYQSLNMGKQTDGVDKCRG